MKKRKEVKEDQDLEFLKKKKKQRKKSLKKVSLKKYIPEKNKDK